MSSMRWPGGSPLVPQLAVVVWLIPAVCAGQQPSAVPKYDQWRQVAQSDLIPKAELFAPVDAIRASVPSQNYSYLTLHAKIIEILKGKLDGKEARRLPVRELLPETRTAAAPVARDFSQHTAHALLARIKDHTIVCDYGRMGQEIAREFQARALPFVVIDRDPALAETLAAAGVLYLIGDASANAVLHRAGVDRARSLVAVARTDADNIFITLSGRSLNPRLYQERTRSPVFSPDRSRR
jgi:hypothetical protein